MRVTNLDNGKTVILRVNDRGPFYSDRIIDLSFAAAKKLGYAESGTARVKVEGIDPHEWWAAQGRPVPMVLAQPKMANQPAPAVAQPVAVAASQPIEQYTPPPEQHAAAVVPVQMDVKKNASPAASGLYLQVAAFANPDAAELLKAKRARRCLPRCLSARWCATSRSCTGYAWGRSKPRLRRSSCRTACAWPTSASPPW